MTVKNDPRQVTDPLRERLDAGRAAALDDLGRRYTIEYLTGRYWRNRAGGHLAPRRIGDCMLLMPVTGTVHVTWEGARRQRVGAGDLLLVPESVSHALALDPACARLEQIALHCHADDAWGFSLFSRFTERVHPLPFGTSWHARFSDLVALESHRPEAAPAFGAGMVRQLLGDLIAGGAALGDQQPIGDPRISRALRLMSEQVEDPPRVTELAARLELSPTRFRQLFRAQVGRPPGHFMNDLRLRHAAKLLRTTRQAVKEIAIRTGYGTDDYFHHAFKKQFGTTPTEYRNIATRET